MAWKSASTIGTSCGCPDFQNEFYQPNAGCQCNMSICRQCTKKEAQKEWALEGEMPESKASGLTKRHLKEYRLLLPSNTKENLNDLFGTLLLRDLKLRVIKPRRCLIRVRFRQIVFSGLSLYLCPTKIRFKRTITNFATSRVVKEPYTKPNSLITEDLV